jgi:hypothetical protein
MVTPVLILAAERFAVVTARIVYAPDKYFPAAIV